MTWSAVVRHVAPTGFCAMFSDELRQKLAFDFARNFELPIAHVR
jgi:hypothetical protein